MLPMYPDKSMGARVIMQVLGHTTITTTMNVYAHVLPTLMRDGADAMDRALGGS